MARWYNQLSRANIHSWKDLVQAFMKQYRHVMDIAPDRIVLQNIEKKPNESFRQYAQRWREVIAQVQPPLLEKEITMLFINTLKAPFLSHMLGSATKSFSDIVMSGEMIENAIRCGKIEAGESTKRSAPRKKEHEINNASMFNRDHSKSITVGQARAVTANQQGSSKQESNQRSNVKRPQFTPIPVTYRELYQNLFDVHVVSPFYLKPMQPPYPKWYDANAQCEYHAGTKGHSIENCTVFKKLVEKLINLGIVKIGDSSGPNVAENLLPNHDNKGVNAIIEYGGRRVKANIAEIKTPLEWVWKQMMKRGLIKQGSIKRSEGARKFCEFHAEENHDIQECTEFRTMVQNLMDNKELEFYEEIKGLEEGEVYAAEEGSTGKAQKANHPVVIISKPMSRESEIQIAQSVIIQKPVSFPYKDSKKVPWNYDCNITIPGEESLVNASGEDEGFYTRSGKRYDSANARVESGKGKALAFELGKAKADKIEPRVNQPVTENEAKEFLKFLKHSEYSVVEQLHKQSARISVLELLLSSEVHRNTLIKVLNKTYVTSDISVNKLDRLVNNISADNFIFFNEDEILPGGRGATKALHITARCGEYTLAGVLIDNGSALNVLPLSTLNRLPVDSSHMKSGQNIVRAFDGTKRKVMGRIEIPLLIGPNTYEVDFLVMDIKPSYNCLLGRPWIHSARAVPSSLHQKLKLVTEGRLVTIDAEEDIIASVTSDAPYLGTDDEAIEFSF
ncbi:uncharacterized protein LOC105797447 [Gossypium raimondii]|uniref:uncharacterized protein LOC105797447 n=1 Tax=Gossypium raimondii TaxID=29730 RepID=UPI00227B1882|nr:uncharacterized protein LOC105797447 [Gossypium raimondii]